MENIEELFDVDEQVLWSGKPAEDAVKIRNYIGGKLIPIFIILCQLLLIFIFIFPEYLAFIILGDIAICAIILVFKWWNDKIGKFDIEMYCLTTKKIYMQSRLMRNYYTRFPKFQMIANMYQLRDGNLLSPQDFQVNGNVFSIEIEKIKLIHVERPKIYSGRMPYYNIAFSFLSSKEKILSATFPQIADTYDLEEKIKNLGFKLIKSDEHLRRYGKDSETIEEKIEEFEEETKLMGKGWLRPILITVSGGILTGIAFIFIWFFFIAIFLIICGMIILFSGISLILYKGIKSVRKLLSFVEMKPDIDEDKKQAMRRPRFQCPNCEEKISFRDAFCKACGLSLRK